MYSDTVKYAKLSNPDIEVRIIERPPLKKFDGTFEIPEESNVESVYRGYRQCYSENPFKDKVLSDDRRKELIELAKEKDSNILLTINKYGYIPYTDFLHKCLFIKNHMNHRSPLEHSKVTYQMTNGVRSFSHQHVRFRIASHSQQSQRYVDSITPELNPSKPVRNNKKAINAFDKLAHAVYEYSKDMHEIAKEDSNLKSEDIRGGFVNDTCTQLITSMNYSELIHFWGERCCMRTQEMNRLFAIKLLKIMRTRVPFVFDNVGAKCMEFHICPESNEHSCHRFITKEEYISKTKELYWGELPKY